MTGDRLNVSSPIEDLHRSSDLEEATRILTGPDRPQLIEVADALSIAVSSLDTDTTLRLDLADQTTGADRHQPRPDPAGGLHERTSTSGPGSGGRPPFPEHLGRGSATG